MTESPNPLAAHHLPFFITAPGQTDVLFNVMFVLLLAIVLAIGNVYFQLHALPEKMAHRTNHVQMQIVAVLSLLALFTHNHLFWIGALLLALLQLPDFSTPINSIAQSLERLAGRAPPSPLTLAPTRAIDDEPSETEAREPHADLAKEKDPSNA
jgi:hypothetical protein